MKRSDPYSVEQVSSRGRSRFGSRQGFTLVELMVTITVIGILAALALGAMQKASTSARILKTQSTILKIHEQVITKWESYKYRRLPVDARTLLAPPYLPPYPVQTINARNYVATLYNNLKRPKDPLAAGLTSPGWPAGLVQAPGFPTQAQVAAIRLLALRELQRYEMPTSWSEIINTDQAGVWQGSPGAWQIRPPQVLLTVPQLAQTYLQRINMTKNADGNFPTQQQLQQFDAAECLYLIVKMGSQDDNETLTGKLSDVGDADGDGLLEFQDPFPVQYSTFATNGATNGPIMWIRWPAGFTNINQQDGAGNFAATAHVSDYQEDPSTLVVERTGTASGPGTSGAVQLQVASGAAAMTTFSQDNHDYFDPLRLDLPGATGMPRGYKLTPLIFSGGPDSDYGGSDMNPAAAATMAMWQPTFVFPSLAWSDPSFSVAQQNFLLNDPYAQDSKGRYTGQWFQVYPQGVPIPGAADNITNHVTNAR